MEKQLALFEKEILTISSQIAKEFDYPESTFSVHRNYSQKGKNAGNLISIEVDINEISYPYDVHNKIIKSSSILLIKPDKHFFKLMIRKEGFLNIKMPPSALIKGKLTSSTPYYCVCFEFNDPSVYQYIKSNLVLCLNTYESSTSFGCCSQYKECSKIQKCIHVNKLYAKGCKYRNHLENGNNFLLQR